MIWRAAKLVVLGAMVAACEARAATAQEINLRHSVVVDVVDKTKGAVVNISSTRMVQRRVNQFWDYGRTVNVPATSLGSGFIIHRDGYVVTNNHVIDHA